MEINCAAAGGVTIRPERRWCNSAKADVHATCVQFCCEYIDGRRADNGGCALGIKQLGEVAEARSIATRTVSENLSFRQKKQSIELACHRLATVVIIRGTF